MTAEELAEREIRTFVDGDGTCYWYDGISWEDDLPELIRDEAYSRVFNEMLSRVRGMDVKDPIVHHNGNGHYVACGHQV